MGFREFILKNKIISIVLTLMGIIFGASFFIQILTIQSYPFVGNPWITDFNVIGKGDLKITPFNGTLFGKDIGFTSLKCGDRVVGPIELTDLHVKFDNYYCFSESHFEVNVLSSGKHTLRFEFGDDVAYSYNNATSYTIEGDKVYVNISGRGMLTQEPHTLKDLTNQPVLDYTSYFNTNKCLDFVFLFDTNKSKPLNVEYWTNYSHPNEEPLYDNITYKKDCPGIYHINYDYINNTWMWCNTTETYWENNFTDYKVNASGIRIFWNETEITGYTDRWYFDWKNISSQFSSQNINFLDYTKAYYVTGINFEPGETKAIRPTIQVKPTSNRDIGKYGIIMKFCNDSLQEAYSSGNYVYLDPWWIVIVNAAHLDSNKGFISDIYDDVKDLDDVWSDTIANNEYVRVTFEKNLTSNKDITIYPRVVSGNPNIKVYEVNGTEIIAEFTSLNDNKYNKVYLTDLIGTQNIFDLEINSGSVEFDYIVDPGELDYTAGTPTHFDFDMTVGTDADLNDGDLSAWDVGSLALTEGDYFQLTFDTEYMITNISVTTIQDGSGLLIPSNISVYVGATKVLEYYFDGDDEPTPGSFTVLPNVVGDYVRLVSHNLDPIYPRIVYNELQVYGDAVGPGNTAPTVTANATTPTIVTTQTNFGLNITATDSENATLTAYTQYYINGSSSGSELSLSISNNTNVNISTLDNSSFDYGSELIAEFWVSDIEYNSSKFNSTSKTVNCSVDSDCSFCMKCSGGECVNQDDNEDTKSECTASYDACSEAWIRQGPDGDCDGAGDCDTDDALLNVSPGNVCDSGADVNPDT